MTGKLSKNFHGVGIGPLSNILAVKYRSVNSIGEHTYLQRLWYSCKTMFHIFIKKYSFIIDLAPLWLRDIFGKSMSIDDGVFNSYMAKGSATTLDIKSALL